MGYLIITNNGQNKFYLTDTCNKPRVAFSVNNSKCYLSMKTTTTNVASIYYATITNTYGDTNGGDMVYTLESSMTTVSRASSFTYTKSTYLVGTKTSTRTSTLYFRTSNYTFLSTYGGTTSSTVYTNSTQNRPYMSNSSTIHTFTNMRTTFSTGTAQADLISTCTISSSTSSNSRVEVVSRAYSYIKSTKLYSSIAMSYGYISGGYSTRFQTVYTGFGTRPVGPYGGTEYNYDVTNSTVIYKVLKLSVTQVSMPDYASYWIIYTYGLVANGINGTTTSLVGYATDIKVTTWI